MPTNNPEHLSSEVVDLIAKLEGAKANGDPAKYVCIISVAEAHLAARLLTASRPVDGLLEEQDLALDPAFVASDQARSGPDPAGFNRGEWRPIEFPPRDETYVLIASPSHDGGMTVARFDTTWGDDGWWMLDDGKNFEIPLRGPEPTHWMPLPAPPAIVDGSPQGRDGEARLDAKHDSDGAEGNRTTPIGDGLGEQVERVDEDYQARQDRELKEVVSELAGGARLRLDRDGSWHLVRDLPQPQGDVIDRLMRGGWVETMPNGGTCKLSDAGLLAYLRSTDELQSVGLIDPALAAIEAYRPTDLGADPAFGLRPEPATPSRPDGFNPGERKDG